METITKAWYFQITSEKKQRTVDQMIAHREQYGTSGNCFDLAIWLIHEFRQAKLPSYAVLTPDSHVAVVAINEKGNRYLCDLGDQWIEPILIDRESEEYTEEYLAHFFPGARVKLKSNDDNSLFVKYRRPNGKEMDQTYLLKPISDEQLMIEAEKTQRTLRTPLVEMRIFAEREVIHWEFDDFISFYSSMEGKRMERALPTQTEWAERINKVSGINTNIIKDAFEVYSKYQ
ncbi:hypothetical protein [Paenibacillus sp. DYY-L-2]|uniref:hypothetical protein n=1 Tax=Paenibacillus sp. DYY-L-2 TaxID=3447013 RepID=UPI003F508F83